MRWTVVWVSDAEARLVTLWLGSANKQAVTQACNSIDDQLSTDPLHVGESRDKGRRILLEPPLGVLYTIRPAERTVYVLTVWEFEKKS